MCVCVCVCVSVRVCENVCVCVSGGGGEGEGGSEIYISNSPGPYLCNTLNASSYVAGFALWVVLLRILFFFFLFFSWHLFHSPQKTGPILW